MLHRLSFIQLKWESKVGLICWSRLNSNHWLLCWNSDKKWLQQSSNLDVVTIPNFPSRSFWFDLTVWKIKILQCCKVEEGGDSEGYRLVSDTFQTFWICWFYLKYPKYFFTWVENVDCWFWSGNFVLIWVCGVWILQCIILSTIKSYDPRYLRL